VKSFKLLSLLSLWAGLALAEPMSLGHHFPEEDHADVGSWRFGWHGYARMALRQAELTGSRGPYLIDDHYFESGFAYTRINESSWSELALSAEKGRARFVLGMFAESFSDWNKPRGNPVGQWGIATGFVEYEAPELGPFELTARLGMFWERLGYVAPYDTYMFSRTHTGGLSLHSKIFKRGFLRGGYGAYQKTGEGPGEGYSPLTWFNAGIDWNWVRAGFYGLWSWTEDNEYAFNQLQEADGSLRVLGGDLWLAIPGVGPLYLALGHYKAEDVRWVNRSFELLHSQGGNTLANNYLGQEGTGELLATHWALTWNLVRSTRPFLGSTFNGLDLQLFGMTIHTIGTGASEDPNANRHDRFYLKWGSELIYRSPHWLEQPFLAFRFDRVILDMDHDSLGFRVITSRLGMSPAQGMEIFLSYSRYDYGENIGELERVKAVSDVVTADAPDEDVFKIQAQVRW